MSEPDDADQRARTVANVNRLFACGVPHNAALGIVLEDFDPRGEALIRLPYRADLVGNPETGALHGGAINALVDACCGAAVFFGMRSPRPIATLDLRIDVLGPTERDRDLWCRARCIKIARHVAFATATAFHGPDEAPLVNVAATFMIFGRGRFEMGYDRSGGDA